MLVDRLNEWRNFRRFRLRTPSTTNARTETVATTASYRRPFRQRQWCIVPAQRFFEPYYDVDAWNAGARKSQRHAIARADAQPLGIAGLWESWQRSAQDPDPLVVAARI